MKKIESKSVASPVKRSPSKPSTTGTTSLPNNKPILKAETPKFKVKPVSSVSPTVEAGSNGDVTPKLPIRITSLRSTATDSPLAKSPLTERTSSSSIPKAAATSTSSSSTPSSTPGKPAVPTFAKKATTASVPTTPVTSPVKAATTSSSSKPAPAGSSTNKSSGVAVSAVNRLSQPTASSKARLSLSSPVVDSKSNSNNSSVQNSPVKSTRTSLPIAKSSTTKSVSNSSSPLTRSALPVNKSPSSNISNKNSVKSKLSVDVPEEFVINSNECFGGDNSSTLNNSGMEIVEQVNQHGEEPSLTVNIAHDTTSPQSFQQVDTQSESTIGNSTPSRGPSMDRGSVNSNGNNTPSRRPSMDNKTISPTRRPSITSNNDVSVNSQPPSRRPSVDLTSSPLSPAKSPLSKLTRRVSFTLPTASSLAKHGIYVANGNTHHHDHAANALNFINNNMYFDGEHNTVMTLKTNFHGSHHDLHNEQAVNVIADVVELNNHNNNSGKDTVDGDHEEKEEVETISNFDDLDDILSEKRESNVNDNVIKSIGTINSNNKNTNLESTAADSVSSQLQPSANSRSFTQTLDVDEIIAAINTNNKSDYDIKNSHSYVKLVANNDDKLPSEKVSSLLASTSSDYSSNNNSHIELKSNWRRTKIGNEGTSDGDGDGTAEVDIATAISVMMGNVLQGSSNENNQNEQYFAFNDNAEETEDHHLESVQSMQDDSVDNAAFSDKHDKADVSGVVDEMDVTGDNIAAGIQETAIVDERRVAVDKDDDSDDNVSLPRKDLVDEVAQSNKSGVVDNAYAGRSVHQVSITSAHHIDIDPARVIGAAPVVDATSSRNTITARVPSADVTAIPSIDPVISESSVSSVDTAPSRGATTHINTTIVSQSTVVVAPTSFIATTAASNASANSNYNNQSFYNNSSAKKVPTTPGASSRSTNSTTRLNNNLLELMGKINSGIKIDNNQKKSQYKFDTASSADSGLSHQRNTKINENNANVQYEASKSNLQPIKDSSIAKNSDTSVLQPVVKMTEEPADTSGSKAVDTSVPQSVVKMTNEPADTSVPQYADTSVRQSVVKMTNEPVDTTVSQDVDTSVPHQSVVKMTKELADTSVPKSVDTSVSQSGDTSAPKSADTSVPMYSDASVLQPIVKMTKEPSAPKYADTSVPQSANTSVPKSADTSVPQYADTSVLQPVKVTKEIVSSNIPSEIQHVIPPTSKFDEEINSNRLTIVEQPASDSVGDNSKRRNDESALNIPRILSSNEMRAKSKHDVLTSSNSHYGKNSSINNINNIVSYRSHYEFCQTVITRITSAECVNSTVPTASSAVVNNNNRNNNASSYYGRNNESSNDVVSSGYDNVYSNINASVSQEEDHSEPPNQQEVAQTSTFGLNTINEECNGDPECGVENRENNDDNSNIIDGDNNNEASVILDHYDEMNNALLIIEGDENDSSSHWYNTPTLLSNCVDKSCVTATEEVCKVM